jgi:hypothetical protein
VSRWEAFILITKLLFTKPGEIISTVTFALRVDKLIIGPVAKQYGPFRFHEVEEVLRNGRILDSPMYFGVVGELAVPVTIAMRTGDNDPQGWTRLVRRREGPFRDCLHVVDLPVTESTYHDLYDELDSVLRWKQTVIESFTEQLTVARDRSKRNRRRAKFYSKKLAVQKAEYRIVNDAFQAFLKEYPDAVVGSKRTPTKIRRETRRIQSLGKTATRKINRTIK